jgi:Protein of unknown function (DUF2924)
MMVARATALLDMPTVQDELARLVGLPRHRLRIEWRRQFRSEPPAGLSRDLLLRAVTYKVQERVCGGLSQMAKRTLRSLAARSQRRAPMAPSGCRRRSSPVCVWCASGAGRRTVWSRWRDGFEYQAPAQLQRIGKDSQFIVGVGASPNAPLIQLLVRAQQLQQELLGDSAKN